MDYEELVGKVIELLQREKRIPYRALKRRFDLDDDYIDDLKIDLIEAKRLAIDENDRILVWIGAGGAADTPPLPTPSTPKPASAPATAPEREPFSYTPRHLAEKILTSRSALEGERKQVTVLFCDLANSTAIAERIGPEHMHTLLNRFFALALEAVHRYEGTINQFLGDGFMTLFGAPIAHEDHARRAVLSAFTLQRTLQEADLGKSYGVECTVRMGLNSGLVVVGSIGDNLRMDYSAIGDTANLAARLQGIAAPGEILVSESTSRLVGGYVRVEPLPPAEVKGKAEPVTPYKAIGTLPRRSSMASRGERTLSQFVGREQEFATLAALFTQVEAGHGQVAGIVAEAGGGKSRLLYESRHRWHDKRVTYLEGRCVSYGSTIPYHPIIDLVRQNCGIAEGDSAATMGTKVRFALQEVGMDAEESAPYLLQLLGVKEGTVSLAALTPEAVRTRTLQQYHERTAHVLTEQFPETAATQPELLAHHFTEAGLHEPAVDYWLKAGQQSIQRSAHEEALVHLYKGVDLVKMLPETPARIMVNQYRRDDQAVQECIEPAVHLSTEHDFAQWLAFSTTLRGWVLLQQAQYKAVIVEMCQGLAAYQATGAKMLQPYFRALLAEGYSIAGQITPGLTIVAEALELVEQTTERFHAAELHRLKGQLLLAQASDRHTEAEICFHHALDIARNQQARSLGLRAATSLARLWQRQGKRAEARQVLGDVYGWFTEGFETADLKEAQALLDALQA